MDIKQQEPLTVVREETIVDAVVRNGADAGTFAARGSDRRDGLLARIETGRPDGEVSDAARG